MSDRVQEVLTVIAVAVALLVVGAGVGTQIREAQICEELKKQKTTLTFAFCRSHFLVVPAGGDA